MSTSAAILERVNRVRARLLKVHPQPAHLNTPFAQILSTRGLHGVIGLKKLFKDADSDRDGCLNYEEFADCLRDCGLGLSSQELRVLFVAMDSSQSDQIRFGPFIETLRGSPSPQRLESIKQVFSTIDSDKDGSITLSDIGACLNPKVIC
jgi:hypothetical protein